MKSICKYCGKEYIVKDKMQDTGYCPACQKMQDEQNRRCAEMSRAFSDEPMDWKDFEEDIMEFGCY